MRPAQRHSNAHLRWLPLIALLLLALAACGTTEIPQNTLDPASTEAEKAADLFWIVFWVATVVFVLVQGALIVAIVKFRQKGEDDDRPVKQVHGNTRLEIIWTIIPTVILAAIAVPTLATLFELRAEAGQGAMQVNVIGHQWWWEFEYPEYGFTTSGEMWMPAGREVVLVMTSADVIHSFWVPRLNGKRDVVPGRLSELTMQTNETGWYLGQCAEFCGLAHADMRQRVNVVPPAEFEAWAQRMASPAVIPTEGLAAEGFETFGLVCSACHAIDGTDYSVALAPNLTHFGSRVTFGGASFDNTTEHLRAWLRNPSSLKPMRPDLNDLAEGRILGMPNFGLTEGEIDGLLALLDALD